jgi:hypothetical protein
MLIQARTVHPPRVENLRKPVFQATGHDAGTTPLDSGLFHRAVLRLRNHESPGVVIRPCLAGESKLFANALPSRHGCGWRRAEVLGGKSRSLSASAGLSMVRPVRTPAPTAAKA